LARSLALARLALSHPGDSCQPPALVLPPPQHSSHPPALLALFHAPSPALLRSHTPCATPSALCLCTVNSRKVDLPSRLSPRGQRNLTQTLTGPCVQHHACVGGPGDNPPLPQNNQGSHLPRPSDELQALGRTSLRLRKAARDDLMTLGPNEPANTAQQPLRAHKRAPPPKMTHLQHATL
ncbi:hypothetical protein C0993_011280, partial [Termitomyces sp. T159_Od127]